MCLALNMNINIIQEDHIWSAMHQGIDFKDLTFILSDYGVAILCLLEETSDAELVTPQGTAEQTEPEDRAMMKWSQGGRLVVTHVRSSSSSPTTDKGWHKSDTNTDIDGLSDL